MGTGETSALSCLTSPSGKVVAGSKDSAGLTSLGRVGEGNTARGGEAWLPHTDAHETGKQKASEK